MLRFFVLISIIIGCPNACYGGSGYYRNNLPVNEQLNVKTGDIDVNQLEKMNAAELMSNKGYLRKNWGTYDKPCYGINLVEKEELKELGGDAFDGFILSVIDPERVQYLNKDVLFREYEVDDESKPGTVKKEMGINIVPKDGLAGTMGKQFEGVDKKKIEGINSDRLGYLSGDVVGCIFNEVSNDRLGIFSARQLKNIKKANLNVKSDFLSGEAQTELFKIDKLDRDKLKEDVRRAADECNFHNSYSGVDNSSGIYGQALMAQAILGNDSVAFDNLLEKIEKLELAEKSEKEIIEFIEKNVSITVIVDKFGEWSPEISKAVGANNPEKTTYCDGGGEGIRYVDDEHKNKKLLLEGISFFRKRAKAWKYIFKAFGNDDKYGDHFGKSVDENILLAAIEEGALDGLSLGSLPYKMLNNLVQTLQQGRALGSYIKYLPKKILKEKVMCIPSEYIPLLGGDFFAYNDNKDEEFRTDLLSPNQIKHMTSAQIVNTTISKDKTTLCENAVKNFTVDQLNGVKTCCDNSNTCRLRQRGCDYLVLGAIKEAGFFDKIAFKGGSELKDKYDGNIIKNIKIEYISKYFTDFAPGQLFHFTKDILKKDRCHSFKEDKMDENLFKIESLTEEQLKGLFNDHDGSQYDGSDKVDLYCNGANAWNGVNAWTNILVKDKDGNVTGRSITQVLFENNQLKLEHVKKKMNPSNFTKLISQIGKNKDVFKKFFKSDLIGITDQDELKNMRLIDGVKQRKCCVYLEHLSEEQVKRINNQDFVSAILENYIEQQKFQTNADGKLVGIPCYDNADLDALRKCNIAGNKMPDANKMYEYCFISDWIAEVKIDLLVKSFSSLIKKCKSRNWKMSEDVDKCKKYGTLRTLLHDLILRVDDISDCYEKNKLNKDITDSIQTIYDEWLSDEYYDIGGPFDITDKSGVVKNTIHGLEHIHPEGLDNFIQTNGVGELSDSAKSNVCFTDKQISKLCEICEKTGDKANSSIFKILKYLKEHESVEITESGKNTIEKTVCKENKKDGKHDLYDVKLIDRRVSLIPYKLLDDFIENKECGANNFPDTRVKYLKCDQISSLVCCKYDTYTDETIDGSLKLEIQPTDPSHAVFGGYTKTFVDRHIQASSEGGVAELFVLDGPPGTIDFLRNSKTLDEDHVNENAVKFFLEDKFPMDWYIKNLNVNDNSVFEEGTILIKVIHRVCLMYRASSEDEKKKIEWWPKTLREVMTLTSYNGVNFAGSMLHLLLRRLVESGHQHCCVYPLLLGHFIKLEDCIQYLLAEDLHDWIKNRICTNDYKKYALGGGTQSTYFKIDENEVKRLATDKRFLSSLYELLKYKCLWYKEDANKVVKESYAKYLDVDDVVGYIEADDIKKKYVEGRTYGVSNLFDGYIRTLDIGVVKRIFNYNFEDCCDACKVLNKKNQFTHNNICLISCKNPKCKRCKYTAETLVKNKTEICLEEGINGNCFSCICDIDYFMMLSESRADETLTMPYNDWGKYIVIKLSENLVRLSCELKKVSCKKETLVELLSSYMYTGTIDRTNRLVKTNLLVKYVNADCLFLLRNMGIKSLKNDKGLANKWDSLTGSNRTDYVLGGATPAQINRIFTLEDLYYGNRKDGKYDGFVSEREYFEHKMEEITRDMRKSNIGCGHISCYVDGRVKRKAKGGEKKKVTCKTCKKLSVVCGNCCQCKDCCFKNQKKCIRCGFALSDTGRICEKSDYFIFPFLGGKDFDKRRVCFYDSSSTKISDIYNIESFWTKKKDTAWETLKGNRDWKEKRHMIGSHLIPLINDKDKDFINKLNEGQALLTGAASSIADGIVKMVTNPELHEFCRLYKAAEMQRGLLAQKVPKVKSRKYDKGLEMYEERVKKRGKDKCQCVPYRVIDGSKNNNIKHLQDEDRLEYYKSLKHYSDCSTALKGSDVGSIEKHFNSYPHTSITVPAPSGKGTISRLPTPVEIKGERDKCIKDIGGVCARDIFNKQLENFAFSGADVVELFSKTGTDYNYKGIVDDVKEKFRRYSFLWNYSNATIIKPGEGNPNWKFKLYGASLDVMGCMKIPSVASTIKNYIESAKISSIDSFHEELWKVLGKTFWTLSKEIFPEDKDFLLRRKYSELWSRGSALLPEDIKEFSFCNLKKAYQEHHGKMRDILESLRLYFYECVSAKNGPKTPTKIPKYSDFEYVYEDLINSGIVCDSFINLVPIEVLLRLLAKNNSPINLRLCCCLSSRKLEEMYKVLFRSDLPDEKEVIEKLATGQPNFTGGSNFKMNKVATRWKSIVDTAVITDNDREIITKNLLSIFNSGCEVSCKGMRHFIEKFINNDTVAPQIKDVIERACREVCMDQDPFSGKIVAYYLNVLPNDIALWWKGVINCPVGGASGLHIFLISYLNKMVENFVNNLNVSLVMNLLEGSEDEHKEALYPYIYRVLLSYVNRRANEKSTLVVDLDKYKNFKMKDCRPEKVADIMGNCKKGRKSHSYNASEVLKQENGRMGIFGGEGKVMPYLNDGRIGNFEESNRIEREIDRDKKNKESIENDIRIVNKRNPNWLGSKGEKDEYIEKKQENYKNLKSLVEELKLLYSTVSKIGAHGADYAEEIVNIWVKILEESGITDYDYSDKSHKSFGKRVEYLSKLFRKCDDNIVDNVVNKVIDFARIKPDNKVLVFMISNGFCGKRVHATKIYNEIFASGNFEELFAELVNGRISANIVKFFKRNAVLELCRYILDEKRWDYRNNKILEEKKSGKLLKCANIVEVLNEIKKCNNQVEYYLTEKCLDGMSTPDKIKEIENFVNGLVVESVKDLNSKIDGCASFSMEEKAKIKDYVGKNVFTEGFLKKLVDSNDVDGIVWLIINGMLGEHDYKTLENLYKDKLKKILTDIVDNFFIWELKGQDGKKKRMLLTKISEWFKSLTEDQQNTVVKRLLVLEKSVSSSDKEKNEVLGEYVENFDYSAVVVNDTTKEKMLYKLVLKKIIGNDANVDAFENSSVKIVNLFVQQNEDNWDFFKHLYEEGSIENYTYLDSVLYINNILDNEIRRNQYDFKGEDKKKYKVVKICLDGVVDKLVEDKKYHENVFYPKSGTCTHGQIYYFVYRMVKKYKESGDIKIKESIKSVFLKHINVDKFAKATTGTGDRKFSWGWLVFCPNGDLRCKEKDLNDDVGNVNNTIWPAVADLIFNNYPFVFVLLDPYENVRPFYKSLMDYLSLGSLGNKDVQDFIWREVFISLDVNDTKRPKLKEHILGGAFKDDVLEQFFRCDQKFVFDMIESRGFGEHFGQYIGLPDWIKYLYMFGSQNNLPLISLDGKAYINTGSLSFFIDNCQEGDDIGKVDNGFFGNKGSSLFGFVESFYGSGIKTETVGSLKYYLEKIKKIKKIKVLNTNSIENFVNKSVYESMLKLLGSYRRDKFENDRKMMNGDQRLLHEEQFKLMKNFILGHSKPSGYLNFFKGYEKLGELRSFLDSIRKFLCNVSLGDFSGLMPGEKKDALSGDALDLFDENLWIYYFIVNFDKSEDPYKSGIDLEEKINKLVCLHKQVYAPGPEMIPVCMNPVLINKVGKLDGGTILQLFSGGIDIDTKLADGGKIEFQYFDDKILEVLDEDSFSILFLGHLGKYVIKELFRAVAEKEDDVDSEPTSKVIGKISREFNKSIFCVENAKTYNLWKYKNFRDCVRKKYMNLFNLFYSSHPEVYNDNNLYKLLKECYNGNVNEREEALCLVTPLLGKDRMMGTYEYLIMCKNNIDDSNFDTEKMSRFNDDGSAFNFVKEELTNLNLLNLQKLSTFEAEKLGCDYDDLDSFLKMSLCDDDNFVKKISEHLLKKRGSLREQMQLLQAVF